MHWLNIHSSTLDSPQFKGSEPVDRATWLCLQRYCIGQENGGKISDCAEWGDRFWMQTVGATKAEVLRPCRLWTWRGKSLVVWRYPIEAERKAKRLRIQGRSGAAKRWQGNGTAPTPDEDPGQFPTALEKPHFTENENLYHDISGQ